MRLSEHDAAAFQAMIDQALAVAESQARARKERLASFGARLTPDPQDRFWPTYIAFVAKSQRQIRLLTALRRVVRELGPERIGGWFQVASELWGSPFSAMDAQTTRFGWRPGHPKDEALLELDLITCEHAKCPHCETPELQHRGYVREGESGQEYRGFARCPLCGLVTELLRPEPEASELAAVLPPVEPESPAWAPPAEPAVVRRGSAKQAAEDAARQNALVPPFRDPETDEWYRPERDGPPTLIHTRTDKSLHYMKAKDQTCWACVSAEPHSDDFHDRQVLDYAARYISRRVTDHGAIALTHHDEIVNAVTQDDEPDPDGVVHRKRRTWDGT